MNKDSPETAAPAEEAPAPDSEPPESDLFLITETHLRRDAENAEPTDPTSLEHAYQKSIAEAQLLYEAGSLLGSTLDPDTIFETLRTLVSGIMSVDSLIVSWFDSQTNLISCSYAWIEGSHADVSGFPAIPLSPDGRGMQSTVILTGKPLRIGDAFERAMSSRSHYHVDSDGKAHAQPTTQKPQSRSILMVPIKLEGQVLGVVQIQSLQPAAYTEDHLRLLEAIVLQMAAAYRNAFLYQQIKAELAERQRTEQALRASETQYRNLVETSNDLIWSIGPDGKVLFVNQAAQRILGYDPQEMVGQLTTDFLAEEQMQQALADMPQFLRDKAQMHCEMTFQSKAGVPTLLSINGVVLRDDQGNILGATGTAADITERRRLQEQLLQAQKMESIGRLAGGVAHDFNNLMTAVLGYSSFAQMSLPPDSDMRRDLERIQQAAHRASDLTQQLLAFARKQIVAPRIVDLNDLILDIDKMLRRLIGADIELVILPTAERAHVRIDPGQFEQVLVNLVINARDAMPRGGKLSIETSNVPLSDSYGSQNPGEANEHVLLTVTDTGVGMTPEVRAHLFEPFFTTKEVGKGTGLGLATCYGIVQQHNGHIQVQSEPGKGTTFRIYLPCRKELAQPGSWSETPTKLPGGTETLLLVEDEFLVSDSAVQTLHALSYTVLTASNGHEALRLVHKYEGQIDLIITDIVMPQMGGIELAERLREEYPEIPVLFMSGYLDTTLELGDRGFISEQTLLHKPFTPAMLAQKIRRFLDTSA
jgi:PAS domain S-box-containing protein